MTRTILIMMSLIFFTVDASAEGNDSKSRSATITLNDGRTYSGSVTGLSLDKLFFLIGDTTYQVALDDIVSISFANAGSTTAKVGEQTPARQTESTTTGNADNIPASQKLSTKGNGGILSIEAGIVYVMGGVQPVARSVFYMVDVDPNIFSERKIEHPAQNFVVEYFIFLSAYPLLESAIIGGDHMDNTQREKTNELLRHSEKNVKELNPHIVQMATTDFQGRATFKPVIPGVYYIIGTYEARGGNIYWDIPVQIETGENSVMIDANNAIYYMERDK